MFDKKLARVAPNCFLIISQNYPFLLPPPLPPKIQEDEEKKGGGQEEEIGTA